MSESAKRKQIRDTVKALLASQLSYLPTLRVYTQQRSYVPEGVDHYANVFFLKGDVEHSGNYREDSGTLIIRISTTSQRAPDDELDDLNQHIESVIDASADLGGIVESIQQNNWQYGMDEQTGHTWLGLVYAVTYTTQFED